MRFLGRAAKIVAESIAVSSAATDIMMLLMFGRYRPADTAGFPLRGWAASKGLNWEEKEFLSGENTLRGYIVRPESPKALIVFAHGMNASSNGYEPLVKFFAEKGYAVFIFDGTASGRSGGDRVIGLQQPRLDLRAAVRCVAESGAFTGIPVVLMGHSAGAYGAATEALETGAAAAVCVSGFDTPIGTMHKWAKNYAKFMGDVQLPFLFAHEFDQLGSEANTSASRALVSSGVPALVIHGANDNAIPLNISLYQRLESGGCRGIELYYEQTPGHDAHSDIIFGEHGQPNLPLLERINSFLVSVLP